MKKALTLCLCLLALPLAAAQGEFLTGYQYLSYDSNFTAHGTEQAIPLSLRVRLMGGRLKLNANTSYFMGAYRQDAVPAVGLASSSYDPKKLSDSLVGGSFEFALGSFSSVLALQLNLPTGDERWELDQLIDRQSPGNIPSVFVPTRYRGRAFGVNGLLGLGREFAKWNLGLAGGYLNSGSVEVGALASPVDLNAGDYWVGVVTLSRKMKGSRLRFKASEAIAQNTEIDGQDVFKSPPCTVLDLDFSTTGENRFALGTAVNLYGKGRVTDILGVLTDEAEKSLGTRIEVKPSYRYSLGKRTGMETRLRWKYVLDNGYAEDDLRFEGGGVLLGAAQGFRYKTRGGLLLGLDAAYDRILHEKAAHDSGYRFTNVAYNVLALKSTVGVSW